MKKRKGEVMKNLVRMAALIMMLSVNNRTHGYIYRLRIVKKKLNKQRSQWIILLGDYHDKKHPANNIQRAYLDALLHKCVACKGKLIVEDLSSINNDGRMICCNFGINCAQGILGQLASKARELGVSVDNVEFRYCRVAGIGPLINNIKSDPHSFRSSSLITILSLHKEIIDELEKIKKYDDGKKLNAFYKRTVAEVRSLLAKMGLDLCDKKISIAQHCAQLQSGAYRQELEKLCIFDSALIDTKIIHSIVRCDAPFIFVVAGGSHIDQVHTLLKRSGYASVFITPENNQQPVDMMVIDKFVP
jgi:hypothetical protein